MALYFWTSRAAEPVTMGAAPEVPPNGVVSVPVPNSAEVEPPGAPISGLMRLSWLRGPREDVPTMVSSRDNPTLGSMVTLAPATFRRAPSALVMEKAGVVTVPPP